MKTAPCSRPNCSLSVAGNCGNCGRGFCGDHLELDTEVVDKGLKDEKLPAICRPCKRLKYKQ